MTKKFIILIIFSTLGLKLSAQQVSKTDSPSAFTGNFNTNKVVLEVYKIDSAQVNGIDLSQRYRNASAAIIFYTQSNYRDTVMTVIMPGEDSESWGEIQRMNRIKLSKPNSSERLIKTQLNWNFTNTIDGLSGDALVTITETFKSNELIEFKIQGNNGINCHFKGFQLNNP